MKYDTRCMVYYTSLHTAIPAALLCNAVHDARYVTL